MRILKKVLLYTTIIAVFVPAILVVFGFIYQDKIVKKVLTEVNKSLNSEIKVDQIEFSFLSHFPLASVNLNNITGFESKNFSVNPDSLFHFQNLALSFNILDVIQSNYVLQSITVSKGFVNLEIDKKGFENYLIVTPPDTDSGNFFINLEEVEFEDCIIKFRDFRTDDQYGFYFPNLTATGTFSSDYITTSLYGSTKVNALVLDKTRYLTNEIGKVDVGIEIDLVNHIFQISRGYITLKEKYAFEVKGKSVPGRYKYTFKATSLDLQQAETLIPKKHVAFIKTYEINGTANLFLELSKNANDTRPTINGTFDLWDGVFKNKNTLAVINISKASGRYDLGKKGSPETTQIWIDKFIIETKEGRATGTFALSNLSHPWYKIETMGRVDLNEIEKFYDFGDRFSMYGIAEFTIKMRGSFQQVDSVTIADLKTIRGVAKVQLQASGFRIYNVPNIDSVSANIALNEKNVKIENFYGLVANSPTVGSISANNWFKYAMNQSNEIHIEADLSTQKLNTSDFINHENESEGFSFPKTVSFYGDIKVREFNHQETFLKNISTIVLVNSQKIHFTNTRFNAFSGGVKCDFMMVKQPNKIEYKIELLTQNMDVQNLLKTYDDFGQSAVTHTHLRGELKSNLSIGFVSDRSLSIDKSSITVEGDIMLTDGEMIENKILTSIPREIESNKIIGLFINLDEFEKRLHHIKFDTIRNHIRIKNSVLTIPEMYISSSALNIDVKGTHSFSNEMDYYISFNLNAVLSRKKRITTEYGYIKDDEYGNRMMFLHVYTKKGEVKVELDKSGSKNYRNQKSSVEVREFKSVLNEEFGAFENDSNTFNPKEQPTFEYEIDLGEFGADTVSIIDSNSVKKDSTKTKNQKKKKQKNKEDEDFEEFDFEDDDY